MCGYFWLNKCKELPVTFIGQKHVHLGQYIFKMYPAIWRYCWIESQLFLKVLKSHCPSTGANYFYIYLQFFVLTLFLHNRRNAKLATFKVRPSLHDGFCLYIESKLANVSFRILYSTIMLRWQDYEKPTYRKSKPHNWKLSWKRLHERKFQKFNKFLRASLEQFISSERAFRKQVNQVAGYFGNNRQKLSSQKKEQ